MVVKVPDSRISQQLTGRKVLFGAIIPMIEQGVAKLDTILSIA